MKLSSFMSTWDGTRQAVRGLAVACVGLSVVSMGLLYLVLREDRTITLVPPDHVTEISISRSKADPGYIQSWSYYVATILGNATPGNADFIKQSVAPLLCPEIYHSVVVALEAQLDQIRQDRVTARFEPRRIKTEPETGKTFVSGLAVLQTITGQEDRFEKTYEMKVTISNYRPQVCALASYRGAPKTVDALKTVAPVEDNG